VKNKGDNSWAKPAKDEKALVFFAGIFRLCAHMFISFRVHIAGFASSSAPHIYRWRTDANVANVLLTWAMLRRNVDQAVARKAAAARCGGVFSDSVSSLAPSEDSALVSASLGRNGRSAALLSSTAPHRCAASL